MEKQGFMLLTLKFFSHLAWALAFILGLVVVLSWHFHIEVIVQLDPDQISMKYNTALSLVAAALALFFLLAKKPKVAAVIGLILLLHAVLVTIEYLFHLNFGIDQLFVKDWTNLGRDMPGRMGPNTAFCFMLISLAFIFYDFSKRRRNQLISLILFGIAVFSFSALFTIAYFVHLRWAYAWGGYTPMSLHTMAGMVLVSLGMVTFGLYSAIKEKIDILDFLPWAVMICFESAVIVLWLTIVVEETRLDKNSIVPALVISIGSAIIFLFSASMFFLKAALRNSLALNKSLSLIQASYEASNNGLLATDLSGAAKNYNKKYLQICGLPSETDLTDTQDAIRFFIVRLIQPQKLFNEVLNFSKTPDKEINEEFYCTDGRTYEVYSAPQYLKNKIIGRVWVIHDATKRKKLEEKLLLQSTHDDLTRLPNRILLNDRIRRAISMAKKSKTLVGVIMLDMDRFKYINDSLGHALGDEFLKQVALRLRKCVRETDTVARVGGDEFVVLVPELLKEEEVLTIIERALQQLSRVFEVRNHSVSNSASIGISFYPKDGATADELLKNADSAMYRAKYEGGNQYKFFSEEINQAIQQRVKAENALKTAIKDKSFILRYQPIIDIQSKKVTGVEALVRLVLPDQQLLDPTEFIFIAEENGLINELGDWVLETACRDMQTLMKTVQYSFMLAVNVSTEQLRHRSFIEEIQQILASTGFNPNLLELEITESKLIKNTEELAQMLQHLKQLGVTLAIDDFGSGYSGLNYIRLLPIQYLKIDQSLITDIGSSVENMAIIRGVIYIAEQLGITVIAEGIETETQKNILVECGCRLMQGFYFSEPLTIEKLQDFIKP